MNANHRYFGHMSMRPFSFVLVLVRVKGKLDLTPVDFGQEVHPGLTASQSQGNYLLIRELVTSLNSLSTTKTVKFGSPEYFWASTKSPLNHSPVKKCLRSNLQRLALLLLFN